MQAVRADLALHKHRIQRSHEILEELSPQPNDQASIGLIREQLDQSVQQLQSLEAEAHKASQAAREIEAMLPGSGPALQIATSLRAFVQSLQHRDVHLIESALG